jgi:hypothetical protein
MPPSARTCRRMQHKSARDDNVSTQASTAHQSNWTWAVSGALHCCSHVACSADSHLLGASARVAQPYTHAAAAGNNCPGLEPERGGGEGSAGCAGSRGRSSCHAPCF